jgi:hypothetical protein
MLVTLFPMVTLVNPLQPSNAPFPMLVTVLGMVTLVKLMQLENAQPTMLTTGIPFMEGGITAGPPGQVYLVIVTVPPDTSYVKSPDSRANATLGKTNANDIMTE